MTKQEALIYLDSTIGNWQENLDNRLFKLKKDLFMQVFIPKLLIKKAERIETWYEASLVLGGEKEVNKPNKSTKLPQVKEGLVVSVLALYRSYESELMKLKMALSRTLKPLEIATLLKQIATLEFERQNRLHSLALALFSESNLDSEVKLSDDNQTGIIISELKQFKKEAVTEKKDLFLLPYFEKDLQRILKSK